MNLKGGYKLKNLYFLLVAIAFFESCSADEPEIGPLLKLTGEAKQPIRDLVEEVFPDGNVFIGSACHHHLLATQSAVILDREFSYVTTANDFKQSYIHPEPGIYQYKRADDWVAK